MGEDLCNVRMLESIVLDTRWLNAGALQPLIDSARYSVAVRLGLVQCPGDGQASGDGSPIIGGVRLVTERRVLSVYWQRPPKSQPREPHQHARAIDHVRGDRRLNHRLSYTCEKRHAIFANHWTKLACSYRA